MSVQGVMFSEAPGDDAVPQHLIEPTYQNRLRVYGRLIDDQRFHSITLIEIEGGFILRATRDEHPWPVLVEFDDKRTTEMLQGGPSLRGRPRAHRETRDLIPNGYEDMLRALGYQLDQRIAENIVITELPSVIAVTGFEPVLGFGEASYRPFSDPLGPNDIFAMQQEAIGRRGTYQHIQNYIPPNFRG